MLKLKQIEAGRVYEFLGEVEQVKQSSDDAPDLKSAAAAVSTNATRTIAGQGTASANAIEDLNMKLAMDERQHAEVVSKRTEQGATAADKENIVPTSGASTAMLQTGVAKGDSVAPPAQNGVKSVKEATMEADGGSGCDRERDPGSGSINVYLKARILKDQVGFHKLVYSESVSAVNSLIESLVNRGKENQFNRRGQQ